MIGDRVIELALHPTAFCYNEERNNMAREALCSNLAAAGIFGYGGAILVSGEQLCWKRTYLPISSQVEGNAHGSYFRALRRL
jgi:hypothetical protein